MKKIILFSLLLSAVFLSGCDRTKQELGLTRATPDEFAVVKSAPLEVPPDLNQVKTLPRPQPGMQRPQEVSPEQEAQAIVLGNPKLVSKKLSPVESVLLQKAGATQSSDDIRSLVNREAAENAEKNRPVVKKLFGSKKDDAAASVVDAPAEATRLQQKKSGETPSIEQ